MADKKKGGTGKPPAGKAEDRSSTKETKHKGSKTGSSKSGKGGSSKKKG